MQLWQNPYAELMQNYADICRKNKKTEKKQKNRKNNKNLHNYAELTQNYAELCRTYAYLWRMVFQSFTLRQNQTTTGML